jgi:hypothetical protein
MNVTKNSTLDNCLTHHFLVYLHISAQLQYCRFGDLNDRENSSNRLNISLSSLTDCIMRWRMQMKEWLTCTSTVLQISIWRPERQGEQQQYVYLILACQVEGVCHEMESAGERMAFEKMFCIISEAL